MKTLTLIGLFLCVYLSTAVLPPQVPIIGVYTEDAEAYEGFEPKEGTTYIAASYVKNL